MHLLGRLLSRIQHQIPLHPPLRGPAHHYSSLDNLLLTSRPPRHHLPTFSFYRVLHDLVSGGSCGSLPSTRRISLLFSGFRRLTATQIPHTGKKILTGCFIGMGAAAGMMMHSSNAVYAMDELGEDTTNSTEYLRDELNTLWLLARKYHLVLALLLMVWWGWKQPLTLTINVVLLLFGTRPSPASIHMFVEQLRQNDMQKNRGLHNTKLLYARKVDVEDYRLWCRGDIELWDKKLHVIGILGGWWIFNVSHI